MPEKKNKNFLFIRSNPSISPLLKKRRSLSIGLLVIFSLGLLGSAEAIWQTAKSYNVRMAGKERTELVKKHEPKIYEAGRINIDEDEPSLLPFLAALAGFAACVVLLKRQSENLRRDRFGFNDHLVLDFKARECTQHTSMKDGYFTRTTAFVSITRIEIGKTFPAGSDSSVGEITLCAQTINSSGRRGESVWRLPYCDDIYAIPEAINERLRACGLKEAAVEQIV